MQGGSLCVVPGTRRLLSADRNRAVRVAMAFKDNVSASARDKVYGGRQLSRIRATALTDHMDRVEFMRSANGFDV